MKPRRLAGVAAVVAIVLVSVTAAVVAVRQGREAAREQDRTELGRVAAGMRSEVGQLVGLTDAASLILRTSSADDRDEMRGLGAVATSRPGVLTVSWLPRVRRGERRAFERTLGRPLVAADLLRGTPVTAPARDVHYPVAWTASPAYADSVGFDIASMPLLVPALERSVATGWAATSGPVPRGFDDPALQVVLFRPVRSAAGGPPAGVVAASLDVRALGSLRTPVAARVQVRDGDTVLAGPSRMPAGSPRETVVLPGRTWSVSLSPSGTSVVVPVAVLVTGLAIAAAVGLLLTMGARRESSTMALVERRLAERRSAEDHLRRERDYSRAVVDALQDGLLVLDADGRVAEVNDRLARMTGLTREELLGDRPPLPFWPDEDAEAVTEAFETARDRDHHEAELRLRRIDGTPLWAVMSSAPLHDADGVPAGRVLTFKDVTGRRAAEMERIARASRDPLTGVANHGAFQERLRFEVEAARDAGAPLALALLDLDDLTRINHVCGHRAGDEALRETARRIGALTRPADLVARVGGEEFAWLMPGRTAEEAMAQAERARRAVAALPVAGVGTVTLSGGVSDTTRADSAPELQRLADGALYWAKANGRNRCVLYRPETVEAMSAEEYAAHLERSRAVATIRALARAVDAKDASTRLHSERVAEVASRIAAALGWSADDVELVHGAGLVHDVGKIGISDAVLFKPGRLTPEEYAEITTHAALGAQIVSGALTPEQTRWVRGHHERWDGGGYPDGLAGEGIPEGARILALADAWDVMTVARSYSAPRSLEDALDECRRESGRQFWPVAVEALERLVRDGSVTIPTGDDPGAPEPVDGSGVALPGSPF